LNKGNGIGERGRDQRVAPQGPHAKKRREAGIRGASSRERGRKRKRKERFSSRRLKPDKEDRERT